MLSLTHTLNITGDLIRGDFGDLKEVSQALSG